MRYYYIAYYYIIRRVVYVDADDWRRLLALPVVEVVVVLNPSPASVTSVITLPFLPVIVVVVSLGAISDDRRDRVMTPVTISGMCAESIVGTVDTVE